MRIAFVVASAAGGVGVVVYALVGLLVPAGASSGSIGTRLADRRAGLEVAAGAGLLLVAGLLALRATGIWFSDAIVWPLVLVTAGAGLLGAGPTPPRARPPRPPLPPSPSRATPPTAPRCSRAPGSASRS